MGPKAPKNFFETVEAGWPRQDGRGDALPVGVGGVRPPRGKYLLGKVLYGVSRKISDRTRFPSRSFGLSFVRSSFVRFVVQNSSFGIRFVMVRSTLRVEKNFGRYRAQNFCKPFFWLGGLEKIFGAFGPKKFVLAIFFSLTRSPLLWRRNWRRIWRRNWRGI